MVPAVVAAFAFLPPLTPAVRAQSPSDPAAAIAGLATGTLEVEVRADGRPLAGARVRAGGLERVTDESGRATVELPSGGVELTVDHPDHVPATATPS